MSWRTQDGANPFATIEKQKKKNQNKKSTEIRFSFRLHFMFTLVNIGLKWLKSCYVLCNGMYASSFSFNANLFQVFNLQRHTRYVLNSVIFWYKNV